MRGLMEAVEGRQHRLQGWPFEFQRFGNGQLLLLGMRVRCDPPKKAKPRVWASNTIPCVARG